MRLYYYYYLLKLNVSYVTLSIVQVSVRLREKVNECKMKRML